MAKQFRYVALNKPYGVLSQFTGEKGDRTLAEFGLPGGVYPAGRLDKDSEGLLLLTDDGPFIKKLLEPKFGHPRTYLVQVEGEPDDQAIQKLQQGVEIKGYKTKRCQAEILPEAPDLPPRDPPVRFRKSIPTTWLEMTLTEGKNRQVRRMTAAVGHPTLRLVRWQIGNLSLEGLAPGEWLSVGRGEVL